MEHQISISTAIAILGAALGMWSWVVAWGINIIRKEVKELKDEVTKARNDNHEQMLEIEHRLTLVESDISRCAVFAKEQR